MAPTATDPDARAGGELIVHASCIAVGGSGALLRGRSGSGKSDLALRCLCLSPAGPLPDAARLVADDRVRLWRQGDHVMAAPPATIAGKLEVRGLGIIDAGTATGAIVPCRIVVAIDLVGADSVERLPDPVPTEPLLGVSTPVVLLAPHEASAALKVLLAIRTYSVADMP